MIELFSREFLDVAEGFLDRRNAMADHGEIVSGADGAANGFFEAVLVQDRAHVQVVGHDEAIEAKLVAQEAGDDARGERGGVFRGLERGIPTVADHHAIDAAAKLAEDGELVCVQLGPGPLDHGQVVMSVDGGGGVAGKMFAAARDAFCAERIVKGSGQPNDFVDIAPIAAAAERVVRLVIEGNVEHRAEIEIKAEKAEEPAGDPAMLPNEIEVALVAQLLGAGWFLPDEAQTRNPATFLVDRDDWLNRAQIAQVIDQFPQLSCALDIAPEEDEATRLHLAKEFGGRPLELFARHTDEEQLTRRDVLHKMRAKVALLLRDA